MSENQEYNLHLEQLKKERIKQDKNLINSILVLTLITGIVHYAFTYNPQTNPVETKTEQNHGIKGNIIKPNSVELDFENIDQSA